ncbi:MAG TPA: hypothetical protein VH253_11930 [Phycisphaerae bacterium]|nr:hypothetical protein [Phycisphaerae bacterium]
MSGSANTPGSKRAASSTTPAPRVVSLPQLQQRQNYGLLNFHADLSPQLLRRIRIGALLSPFIPMEAGEIILEQFPELADETSP